MPVVEDPALYLGDFGKPCTGPAGRSFTALFNQPDVLVQLSDAAAVSRSYEIVYSTAAIALRRGDAVTIDGQAYVVREAPRQIFDGLFSSCMLTKR